MTAVEDREPTAPLSLNLWVCLHCHSPRLYGSATECRVCGSSERIQATYHVDRSQSGVAEPMREELAALCHNQWAGWMRYLFDLTITVGDDCEEIQADDVKRWMRQIQTPYVELSESEKDSDRKEADRIIALLPQPTGVAEAAAEAAKEIYQAFVSVTPETGWTGQNVRDHIALIILKHVSALSTTEGEAMREALAQIARASQGCTSAEQALEFAEATAIAALRTIRPKSGE